VTEKSLEALVQDARAGNREALNSLVERVQQPIYGLAVRMLWHPEDARDATQEILIRIITHLGSFRGESQFMTWAYRVAANYLRTCRRSRVEEQRYTFARFGEELDEHLDDAPVADEWPADRATLLEEVKVGCMLGMLTCLDRDSRLAYVLGEILELESRQAAEILGITPAAFRQRLSRARSALVEFTRAKCGLVRRDNRCHCIRRLPDAIGRGRVRVDTPLFANPERAATFPAALHKVRALDEMRRTAMLYRTHSEPTADAKMLAQIRAIFAD